MDPLIDILLVDDENRNLDALEAILSDRGYRLLRANNADSALNLLLRNDIAAIILDIKMPGVSGFELAQIIKGSKKFRQIPIVFLTAYMLEDQDVIAGYGAGAVDYLTKPVNPEILRHKIAVFAELFRKTRALAELNDTLEERVRERTAELEKSEQSLREADKQKDEFLAVLAHELRNPLAPLRTGLDSLLRSQPPTPGGARTLTIMNRQVDHMVRLIDDLLDVSRISRGVLELKKERTDLSALLRTTIDNLTAQFEQNGQALEASFPKPVFALVDPVRLAQIVGNLLHNAGKFTPKGGKVRVELEEQNGEAIIRVIDSGPGIAKADLERIFDMFTRIERQSFSAHRGLGIGLALARKIAALHNGKLGAFSEGAGRGTTFTLALPALDAQPASAPAPKPVSLPPTGGSLAVLLIEDNEDSSEMLTEWLRGRGHVVDVAFDGPQGIESLQKFRPQLVLCDIGLPGMNGIDVCRTVRGMKLDFRPVMVALSGWGSAADRRETSAAGFDHHFVKPVALDELEQYMANVKVEKRSA